MDEPSTASISIHRNAESSSSSTTSTPTLDSAEIHGFCALHFKLGADTTVSELTKAIAECKRLIFESPQCSDNRKLLVQYLIELRFRIQELEEIDDRPIVLCTIVMGHHFELSNRPLSKTLYCDHCTMGIWNVMRGLYICKDCNFIAHMKCVENVHRTCANLIATNKGELELSICPEKGLASQSYRCAECKASLAFELRWNEPRLCDYSGLYYCKMCHWNNTCEIPARIIHNWDWEKRYVSQAALQLLSVTREMPLINLEAANVKLFSVVTELDFIRKTRTDLKNMVKYLVSCQEGSSLVNSDILMIVEKTPYLYSIDDLIKIRDGVLKNKWKPIVESCLEHIVKCLSCRGKGYYCEFCKIKQLLFPFDTSVIGCEKCNSYYHRKCWIEEKETCPKCIRIEIRKRNLDDFDCDSDDFNS